MNLPLDWDAIELVVFDLDGTLYDATRLRRLMLMQLLADAARRRSWRTLRVLRKFREVREALAEEGADFLDWQYIRTANLLGCDEQEVRDAVQEWIERRPLPLLRDCRWPGVQEVFEDLRGAGKKIAVWSDYPARDKLAALELRADLAVSACDPGIGRLKPDPRGLVEVMELAGVPPSRTLMVGDRIERDVMAARRAGVQSMLRSTRRTDLAISFSGYEDAVFGSLRQGVTLVPA